jgi:hypothetical protein
MSDINVGDLVWIAEPTRCGCRTGVGYIFLVRKVHRIDTFGQCSTCKAITYRPGTLVADIGKYSAEITRLRKIDPPAETTEREKEMAI